MNKKFLENLLRWPKPFITSVDLKIILDSTDDARKSIVKRAVKEGYLLRLKHNFYIIKKLLQKPIDTFELAQLIWGPSYISFESSLNYHQYIPEAVHDITSACVKKSKSFETKLGIFSFEKIPEAIFPIGVHSVLEGESRYLVAYPWKALADMIYCRMKQWKDSRALSEDLRIEIEVLKNSDLELLKYLSENYPNTRTKEILKNLLRSL